MKRIKFTVEFRVGIPGMGPFTEVMASDREQAMILAQAERIKFGYDYQVDHVWSECNSSHDR